MPQTRKHETWDSDGNLVSTVDEIVPSKVITDAEYAQARQTLKAMVTTFYPGGVPTGSPTNAQIRNWLLSLTAGLRFVYDEMDDEV